MNPASLPPANEARTAYGSLSGMIAGAIADGELSGPYHHVIAQWCQQHRSLAGDARVSELLGTTYDYLAEPDPTGAEAQRLHALLDRFDDGLRRVSVG